ncbi:hypothetical protein [Desulfosporosinus sp. SB140]|uniref:hypothetical protein n=1 Tax=Desulfosporosinus paludis TaxID=3115649 RepID=UPI00388ECE1E
MNEDPKKVLAIITDEEAQEIRSLSDALDIANAKVSPVTLLAGATTQEVIDAENAVRNWFDLMADKYGFSREIQCHVNFGPKTICEGFSLRTLRRRVKLVQ